MTGADFVKGLNRHHKLINMVINIMAVAVAILAFFKTSQNASTEVQELEKKIASRMDELNRTFGKIEQTFEDRLKKFELDRQLLAKKSDLDAVQIQVARLQAQPDRSEKAALQLSKYALTLNEGRDAIDRLLKDPTPHRDTKTKFSELNQYLRTLQEKPLHWDWLPKSDQDSFKSLLPDPAWKPKESLPSKSMTELIPKSMLDTANDRAFRTQLDKDILSYHPSPTKSTNTLESFWSYVKANPFVFFWVVIILLGMASKKLSS